MLRGWLALACMAVHSVGKGPMSGGVRQGGCYLVLTTAVMVPSAFVPSSQDTVPR